MIKQTSLEEAVPEPEPGPVSALPTPVVEINSTGPDITVCPGSDHSYARVVAIKASSSEEAVPDSEPVPTEKIGEEEAQPAERPGVWDGHSNTADSAARAAPPAPAPRPLVVALPAPAPGGPGSCAASGSDDSRYVSISVI